MTKCAIPFCAARVARGELTPRSLKADASAVINCWRKDWQDKEAHLLPAKHLSAWIQTNLHLDLADAPFDREDPSLNPTAGACVTCPKARVSSDLGYESATAFVVTFKKALGTTPARYFGT